MTDLITKLAAFRAYEQRIYEEFLESISKHRPDDVRPQQDMSAEDVAFISGLGVEVATEESITEELITEEKAVCLTPEQEASYICDKYCAYSYCCDHVGNWNDNCPPSDDSPTSP